MFPDPLQSGREFSSIPTPGHIETFKRRFSQKDFDRFAALSGDDNPIHVDPEFSSRTRFKKTVAHGMMLYGTICRVIHTRFPGQGTLQIQQELMFRNPTHTETEITVRCEIAAVYPRQHRIELKTDIDLPDGKKACEGKTLLLLPESKAGLCGVDGRYEIHGDETGCSMGNLRVGQAAEVKKRFTAKDLVEYAELTGDANPVCLNSNYAKRIGFKNRIIPGALLGGMFSQLLGTQLPGRGTNWLKQKFYFPAVAYEGELITARVEITRLRPDKNLVNLAGCCTTAAGKRVCQGESLVLVKDLEE